MSQSLWIAKTGLDAQQTKMARSPITWRTLEQMASSADAQF